MSKKWTPSSANIMAGAAVMWECSVCGHQITQADMKASAKQSRGPNVSTPPLSTFWATSDPRSGHRWRQRIWNEDAFIELPSLRRKYLQGRSSWRLAREWIAPAAFHSPWTLHGLFDAALPPAVL